MILFPHIRQRRLSVKLIELTLGEAIAICKLPAERYEWTTTELLRAIARGADKPRPNFVTDPRMWTVQERALLTVIYLSHVCEDGPDFSVGASSKLSDYVDFERDGVLEEVSLGMIGEGEHVMRPLLGLHVQALESLCHDRGEWLIGAIACQIFPKSAAVVDWAEMSDMAVQEMIDGRMQRIRQLPESLFEEFFAAFYRGADELSHFFNIDFDDDGVLFVANEKDGAGLHAPARFPAILSVSKTARILSGRPD